MANDYGVSFAPTTEQAEEARRRGQLEGVPEAIRILSLHMPRVVGARAPSPLFDPEGGSGGGAQGIDPYLSAVMQSLVKTLAPMGPSPDQAPLPGQDSPFGAPPRDPGPSTPPSRPKDPRIFQPLPGGTAGDDPTVPRRPTPEDRRRGKFDTPYFEGSRTPY